MRALPGSDFALHRLREVHGQIQAAADNPATPEAALNSGLETR